MFAWVGRSGRGFAVLTSRMSHRPSLIPRSKQPKRWASRIGACVVLALTALTLAAASTENGSGGTTSDTALATRVQLPAGPEVLPAVDHPFRVGESLKFSVQYGPIHAGSAYLEVPARQDVNGHPAMLLQARAESNGFFS